VSFLNNEQYDNKRIDQLDTDSLLRICNKLNDQLPDK